MVSLRSFIGRRHTNAGLQVSVPTQTELPPPKIPTKAIVVDKYRVPASADSDASAEITIYEVDSVGKCSISLPGLEPDEERALTLLKANLRSSIPIEETGGPEEVIGRYIQETAEGAGILEVVRRARPKLLYFLLRDFAGYWELDPLVNDDLIEEISLTRSDKPARVLHRKYSEYMFMETDVSFESEERLQAFIRRMAQFGGTTISLAQPSLEVTLQGASDRRVTATLGDEISRPGSTLAIRKQRENPMTIVQLAAPELVRPRPPVPENDEGPVAAYEEDHFHKTLSALMAAYFWLLLERTTNVLVAGETSSGKTTLMNAVLSLMNPRAKVVTAEDVLEINLPEHLHWQRLKTRSYRAGLSPSFGRYEYSLSDLLKLSLRFSPTILSLGEMRGEESETLAAAITLGFSTITTIHAENAERCIQRLTTPPMRFREGHVRDITAIATMKKIVMPDGRVARRVVSIDEIKPIGANGHEILNIFRYDYVFDSFSPSTPAEVLDKSYRLNEIATSFGWTSSRVQRSLANRAAYIAESVKGNGFTAAALAAMVKDYGSKLSLRELDRSRD
jgi:flagellar protein FlaI